MKTVEERCPHCKGNAEECGGKTYVAHYHCDTCDIDWEETWCCACNGSCPQCGTSDIEPDEYEEMEQREL